jgi:hypothetical protein
MRPWPRRGAPQPSRRDAGGSGNSAGEKLSEPCDAKEEAGPGWSRRAGALAGAEERVEALGAATWMRMPFAAIVRCVTSVVMPTPSCPAATMRHASRRRKIALPLRLAP